MNDSKMIDVNEDWNEESTADDFGSLSSLQSLASQADRGDFEARSLLHKQFAKYPEFRRQIGTLGQRTETTLARAICGTDSLGVEALKLQMIELRRSLAGKSPSTLERMAIDRVVMAWLYLHYMNSQAVTVQTSDLPKTKALHSQRDRADRAFQTALKSLTDIQKLARSIPAEPTKEQEAPSVQLPKIHEAMPDKRAAGA